MHCFGGGWEQARRSLDLGFLVSFAGNLTYPKAQPLRDVAARLPLDGVLVETDAPWLAPAPDRGKRNEPAWVAQTAQTLAGLLGVEAQEIAAATTKNFFRLFRLQARRGKLIEALHGSSPFQASRTRTKAWPRKIRSTLSARWTFRRSATPSTRR